MLSDRGSIVLLCAFGAVTDYGTILGAHIRCPYLLCVNYGRNEMIEVWQSKKEPYKCVYITKLEGNWYTHPKTWYRNIKFHLFGFPAKHCNIQLVVIGFQKLNGSVELRVWNHKLVWLYA